MPHHHAARTRHVDGSIKDLGQCEVKPCEQDGVGSKRQGGWADHDSLNRDVRPVLLLSIADRGGACVGCVRSLGRVGGSERVGLFDFVCFGFVCEYEARLAQSVERKTLNLVVVGSSPTVGDCFCHFGLARTSALDMRDDRL